jgi:hypothetical protein
VRLVLPWWVFTQVSAHRLGGCTALRAYHPVVRWRRKNFQWATRLL